MKKLLLVMLCCLFLVATAFAGGKAETGAKEAGTEQVTLRFTGWTYDLEKVRQNLEKFEHWVATQADPPLQVKVQMDDAGYGEFDTHVTTVYAGGGTYDVLYSSDQWLAKWAAAGWVVPLEDYFPEVKKYISDVAPYSVQAMTYNGKLYGLPYYTDVMYFVYNKAMLAKAGIKTPPATWAEVAQQSSQLMKTGVTSTPLLIGLKAGSWFDEAFYSLIYSEGGSLFNEKLEAVFNTSSGTIYDVIETLAASINDTKIMPQKVLEMTAVDVQEAFKNGDAAFVIVPGYMMREFNTPNISKVAGDVEVALMPGKTHATDGYTRMYLMGKGALDSKTKQQAAWDLIEFLGGKVKIDGTEAYHVAKRWAVENGLGFSILSLWNDPAVAKAFATMGDPAIMRQQKENAKSKEGMAAPWFAEWISLVRTKIQDALLRKTSTRAALEDIKQQWNDLKAE